MSKETRGNAVREALKAAAESGNRRMIREEDFTEVGGTEGDFADYDRIMTVIEDLGREWCRLKFSDDSAAYKDCMAEIESMIIDHEKTIYSWIRTEETKSWFHADENDGAYIASLTDSFMATVNNTEGVKGFNAPKAHAPVRHSVFRKNLENHFGTKILQLAVISPEHAEFLRNERKLLSAVRRAKKTKEEQDNILAVQKKELAKESNEGAKEYIRKKIAATEKLIAKTEELILKADRAVEKLQADHPDELMHEDTLVEIREAAKRAKEERQARKNAQVESHESLLAASKKLAVSKLSKEQMIAEITAAGLQVPEKATKKELKPLVNQARAAA